jgi:predicted ATPase/class 3 adenylate cyclase
MAREASRATQHQRAAEACAQALAQWRGPALEELADMPFARAEIEHLQELRLTILETLVDVRLALGEHHELVAELARLTAQEPLRERFWAQRMLALYRTGRQSDALRAYQEIRRLLDEELGLAPGPHLVELERKILRQAPELAFDAAPLPSGIVTFLMTDIEGSTRLLHELSDDDYREALEAHNAIVRRAISESSGWEVSTTGDGFLAVFATAADAVTAAGRAQQALHEHPWPLAREVRVRMGLHTGPGAPTRERDYISIAVNEVARVCDAAHGGQIVLSEETVGALRDRLAGRLALRPLGRYRLRGFLEPVALFQQEWSTQTREFPPLRVAAAGHNLPAERTRFVGRETELAQLAQMLAEHQLVTVVGPGGVGKTRTTLQVAARTRLSYPDGVWLANLGSVVDPELIPSVVAASVGVEERSPRPIRESLLDRLSGSQLLLVLDNCEQVLDAAATLADEIIGSSPAVTILASSREPLGVPGEVVLQLSPLPLPEAGGLDALLDSDAVRLFVERARAARSDFSVSAQNAAELSELCRLLDGLPLALELVAPLVRQLALPELVARTRAELLMSQPARGRAARHATLRAAIDWSYRLLDETQRRAFETLGVFAGGFTFSAVDAVSGHGDVAAALPALVDKSLVVLDERGGSRYRMLGTIRRFAIERLDERADGEAVRSAHLRWCLQLAADVEALTGPDQARVLDQLELEQDNLRAALAWAEITAGEHEALGRLALSLVPYWRIRGHFTEGRHWLTAAARLCADERLRADAALGEARFALAQGDYAYAGLVLEQTLAEFRRLEELRGVARSLHALGELAAYQGEHQASRARFEEALQTWTAIGDRRGLALVHHEMGRALRFQGDYDTATLHLSDSLRLYRELDDVRGTADCLHELGRLARRRLDGAAATRDLRAALALYSELGDRTGIARSNYGLGAVAYQERDYDEARARFAEAVASFRAVSDPHGGAWPLRGLAQIAAEHGDYETAHNLFEEVLAIGRKLDSGPVLMSGLWGLGDLARARGDDATATSLLRDALEVALKIGYQSDVLAIQESLNSVVARERA